MAATMGAVGCAVACRACTYARAALAAPVHRGGHRAGRWRLPARPAAVSRANRASWSGPGPPTPPRALRAPPLPEWQGPNGAGSYKWHIPPKAFTYLQDVSPGGGRRSPDPPASGLAAARLGHP
jgi:hypothetical protein